MRTRRGGAAGQDVSVEEIASQSSPTKLLERLGGAYAELRAAEQTPTPQALDQLLVDGYTEEQIWQQVELEAAGLRRLRKAAREPPAALFARSDASEGEQNSGPSSDEEDSVEDEKEAEEPMDGEEEDEELRPETPGPSSKPRQDFFSLEAMERFCDTAEREDFLQGDLDLDDDDDQGDVATALPSEVDQLYYGDFFDEPEGGAKTSQASKSSVKAGKRKSVSFADEEGQEEPEKEEEETMEPPAEPTDDAPLTSHQRRAKKLAEQMSALEEANLAPKSWQMTGEIAAPSRPQNSLLEEHLAFQANAKAAPTITQDSTEALEEMLKQRIRDKAWDDVERKAKPTIDPGKFRKELVLDGEKSKASLADVYEQEFLKQSQAQEEELENPSHVAIQKRMAELFGKLDALFNFHYTPRQPQPEVKVVKKTMAAISVEDGMAPDVAAAAEVLAPEEVRAPKAGELKAAEEADQTDKARERRRKKKRQREIAARKEAKATSSDLSKDQGKTLAKLGKVKRPRLDPSAAGDGKKMGGSSFFAKLQAKVQGEIAEKSGLGPLKPRKTSKAGKGAAYKL